MSQIHWDEAKYGVSVNEMDEQHQHLISLFNDLNEALTGIESECSSEEALRRLIEYTQQHFAREEQLMRRIDFPDYDAHLKTHAYFVTKLKRMEKDLDAGYWVPRRQAITELWDALEDHIINEDRCYGEFAREQG